MSELGRRGFLKLLGSTALVLQASPTSFFDMGPSVALGSVRGYNSFLSLDWVALKALKVLNNNLSFAKSMGRTFDERSVHAAIKVAEQQGWSFYPGSSRFKQGDVISVAGTFRVNPRPQPGVTGRYVITGVDGETVRLRRLEPDLYDIVGMEPIEDANERLADAINDQRTFFSQEALSMAQSVADHIDRRGLGLLNKMIRKWRA